MAESFTATISRWVAQEVPEAVEAIFKESSIRVLTEGNTPISEGGPMPVKTGFLKGSLTVGINSEPADIQAIRPGEAFIAEVAPAELGDVLHARWSAPYAAPVEYGSGGRPGRGFMRKAMLRWVAIVAEVEARLGVDVGR